MYMEDTLFSGMFMLIFILVIGVFVVVIVRGIVEWGKNNNSPVLSVAAKVVDKRQDISHHHTGSNHGTHTNHVSYILVFEVDSGDRLKFSVNHNEYDDICTGDHGKLEFQGTRFLSFHRE